MNRIEWLKERQKGIGGSDVSVLFGCNPFKTGLELYEEKTQPLYAEPDTAAMKRGKALEPVVVAEYKRETGRKIRVLKKMIRDKTYNFMHANIDGHIVAFDGRGPGILEIKCPGLKIFSQCKREGLRDYYQLQMQHYLAVTGWEWGAFAIFSAEQWELIHFDVNRDDELCHMIVDKCSKFWDRVLTKCPPETQQKPDITLPNFGGTVEQNDTDEWERAAKDLKDAYEVKKAGEELEHTTKDNLKAIMGDTQAMEGRGLRAYWRQTETTRFDTKKFKRENRELYDKYTYKKETRNFKPYFIGDK